MEKTDIVNEIESIYWRDANKLNFMRKILAQKLYSKESNTQVEYSKLLESNDLIGFYFDAQWCSPGRDFLQILKSVYEEAKKKKIKFEIIHVSYDADKKTCEDSFNTEHGNWHLWPFNTSIDKDLKKFFDIQYLPKLIVLKPNFDVITTTGRKEIADKGLKAIINWNYRKSKSK